MPTAARLLLVSSPVHACDHLYVSPLLLVQCTCTYMLNHSGANRLVTVGPLNVYDQYSACCLVIGPVYVRGYLGESCLVIGHVNVFDP
jgi:hypothetical protein